MAQKNLPGATDEALLRKDEQLCEPTDDDSSNADSGFISGNLPMSGETCTSEEILEEKSARGVVSERRQFDSGILPSGENKSGIMHLDSRISLSLSLDEKLEKLSISEDSGVITNDLNNPKSSKQSLVESSRGVEKDEDVPWALYYEQDEDGDTQLHLAIAYGHVEVALALIRLAPCAAMLDTKNDRGQAPLHLAVEFKQYSIARWLIIAGAKPCPRDAQGNSPLHIAAKLGKLECVKAITEPVNPRHRDIMALGYPPSAYEKPNLDQWNYLGQTCVHIAAKHRQLAILKHLVACGADVNAREGLEGLSALHYAVLNKDLDAINFLKRCRRVNFNIENYASLNALQYAHLRSMQVTKARFPILRDLESPYSSEEDDSSTDEDEPMAPACRLYDNNAGMSGVCA